MLWFQPVLQDITKSDHFNSLSPGRCDCTSKYGISKADSSDWCLGHFLLNCFQVNAREPHSYLVISQHWFRLWFGVNVGQVLWCLMASPGNNELNDVFHISNGYAAISYSNKPGIILWMRPANDMNERRHYIVTLSLIGWVHTQKWPLIGSYWING